MYLVEIRSIQNAYQRLVSGEIPFTKPNMVKLMSPFRDTWGLTDSQVLSIARNEMSLEKMYKLESEVLKEGRRARLVSLLLDFFDDDYMIEFLADYLIENGVQTPLYPD